MQQIEKAKKEMLLMFDVFAAVLPQMLLSCYQSNDVFRRINSLLTHLRTLVISQINHMCKQTSLTRIWLFYKNV